MIGIRPLGITRAKAAAAPIEIAAISYSNRWQGGGYPTDDPPTIEMMTDGLTSAFYGSAVAGGVQFFRIELTADSFVTSVNVGSSTSFGGWGALYINDAILARSMDGSNWTTITTLTGFLNGDIQTIPVGAVCRYLRILMAKNEYLAVGEFKPM